VLALLQYPRIETLGVGLIAVGAQVAIYAPLVSFAEKTLPTLEWRDQVAYVRSLTFHVLPVLCISMIVRYFLIGFPYLSMRVVLFRGVAKALQWALLAVVVG
jgi:hypothetical protein